MRVNLRERKIRRGEPSQLVRRLVRHSAKCVGGSLGDGGYPTILSAL